MESNLFIELAEEQQEVVAGGFNYLTGSSFKEGLHNTITTLAFNGGSTSNAAGTTTGAGFTYSSNELSQYLKTNGVTKINQPLSLSL